MLVFSIVLNLAASARDGPFWIVTWEFIYGVCLRSVVFLKLDTPLPVEVPALFW